MSVISCCWYIQSLFLDEEVEMQKQVLDYEVEAMRKAEQDVLVDYLHRTALEMWAWGSLCSVHVRRFPI